MKDEVRAGIMGIEGKLRLPEPDGIRRRGGAGRLEPQEQANRFQNGGLPLRVRPHHKRPTGPRRKVQSLEATEVAQSQIGEHQLIMPDARWRSNSGVIQSPVPASHGMEKCPMTFDANSSFHVQKMTLI
jgi:hypothetical protein